MKTYRLLRTVSIPHGENCTRKERNSARSKWAQKRQAQDQVMGRWNPKIHDNTTTRHTFNTNQEVTDKHKDKNLTNTGHYIPLGLLTGDVSSTDNKTFTM